MPLKIKEKILTPVNKPCRRHLPALQPTLCHLPVLAPSPADQACSHFTAFAQAPPSAQTARPHSSWACKSPPHSPSLSIQATPGCPDFISWHPVHIMSHNVYHGFVIQCLSFSLDCELYEGGRPKYLLVRQRTGSAQHSGDTPQMC